MASENEKFNQIKYQNEYNKKNYDRVTFMIPKGRKDSIKVERWYENGASFNAYKLQAMSNLAITFDRKIEKSLKKRFKIWASLSTNTPNSDAWRDVTIKFTRNLPKNVQEEAQTAAQLEGIVSKETQLSVLSIVDNVKSEIEKMNEEQEEQANQQQAYQNWSVMNGESDNETSVLEPIEEQ